jgi:hypothetical protein
VSRSQELYDLLDKLDAAAGDEQMVMALSLAIRNVANKLREDEASFFICERKGDGVHAYRVKP